MLGWLMRQLCGCAAKRDTNEESVQPADAPDDRPEAGEHPAAAEPAEPAAQPAEAALAPLLEINGIGPKTVQHLYEGGYTTVEAVRAAAEDDLAAVEGVGRRAAVTLKQGLGSDAAG